MALFVIALCSLAAGLVLFFIAFAQFFTDASVARWLSRLGSALGIGSAICFLGVAATPWNLLLKPHNLFVLGAFGLLLGAVLAYLLAIRFKQSFPRRFARIFGSFALILLAYVVLLKAGPSPMTPRGLTVQVTAQKIIAFASVLTFFIQSISASRLSEGWPIG